MPERRPTARRRLAELGLLGRRQPAQHTDSEGVRLRVALEELGPLFAGFGRYLGSRVDLLPLATCNIMAATRISDAPGAVDDPPPALAGIDIEPAPFRKNHLHLWRRGTLGDGRAVIVKTIRAGVAAALESQIEDLPVLEDLHLEELSDVDTAVEDYVVWLERRIDLSRELRGLQRLASDVPAFDNIVVPRLWEEHSDRDTLVFSDPGGTLLGHDEESATDTDQNPDRARRLCSAWLQQALLESIFPEGPLEENLFLLEDGRIAVAGGLFTSLNRGTRRSLLDSVISTSRGDPDRACSHLLTACNSDLEAQENDRLQVLFRQAEPFRDGGWSESYFGRRLADTLRVQWRLLRREGIDIPAPVVAFLRGQHQIEICARRLDPNHDGFAAAVDDLTVVAAASRLRETFSVRRVRGIVEATVPVLQEFAQKAETLGTGRNEDSEDKAATPAPRKRLWPEIGGLLLLMVATVISSQALRSAGVGGEWLQGAMTTFFGVLAALTLWHVWRNKD